MTASSSPAKKSRQRGPAQLALDLFSSYGLACALMIIMIVLTIMGTIEQKSLGLFAVQERYFTSLFFIARPFGIPLPLPGAYLVMALFCVNLILGSMTKMRWHVRNIGLVIVHMGIVFLLLSALITHHFGIEGQMTLNPGETSNQFVSYHDWDLVVADPRPADRDVIYRIPAAKLGAAQIGSPVSITDPQWPFELRVEAWYSNAMPQKKGPMFSAPTPVLDGIFLQPLSLSPEDGNNGPGLYLTIKDKKSGAERQAIVWSFSDYPLVHDAGGAPWRIDIERRRWTVPFAITLTKFTHEVHPGTEIPSVFKSDVIKTEDGQKQNVRIEMNAPLRHRGYTFFQASFNKSGASVLAVVKNPADQFPLYALIAIGAGLMVHFLMRLTRFLARERRAREATA